MEHRSNLRGGRHAINQLQSDWNSLGEQSFEFVVLEEVSANDDLHGIETRWIEWLRANDVPLYNSPVPIPLITPTSTPTIKDLRQDRGWSRRRLDEALGVTGQAVYYWEVGTKLPTLRHLQAMATLFEVKMDDITGLATDRAPRDAGGG